MHAAAAFAGNAALRTHCRATGDNKSNHLRGAEVLGAIDEGENGRRMKTMGGCFTGGTYREGCRCVQGTTPEGGMEREEH